MAEKTDQDRLRQRLVGATVLIALVVIFLPMLLEHDPDAPPAEPAIPPEPRIELFDAAGPEPVAAAAVTRDAAPPLDTLDELAGDGAPGPGEPAAQPLGDAPHAPVIAPQGIADAESGPAPEPPRPEPRAPAPPSPPPLEEPTQAAPAARAEPDPGRWHEVEVGKGDTLYAIFDRLGVSPGQLGECLSLGGRTRDLSELRPGQAFRLRVDGRGELEELEYLRGKRVHLHLRRKEGGGLEVVADAPRRARREPRRTVRKPPPAVPDLSAWVVQLASLKQEDNARSLVDRLRGQGYPAFLEAGADPARDKVWRVRVGPELSRSQAESLRLRLAQDVELKGLVLPYPDPVPDRR
jgi:DedD protein